MRDRTIDPAYVRREGAEFDIPGVKDIIPARALDF
jgi:hypothetical protein